MICVHALAHDVHPQRENHGDGVPDTRATQHKPLKTHQLGPRALHHVSACDGTAANVHSVRLEQTSSLRLQVGSVCSPARRTPSQPVCQTDLVQ